MADEDPNGGNFEAGLRWVAQQVSHTLEQLEDLDLETISRMTGVEAERAQEFLDGAKQWLSRADDLAGEAALRFGGLVSSAASGQTAPSGVGPHPLDVPTPAQGMALSAIDSGRWTVEPGSHVLVTDHTGPAPTDSVGLVGELRARDWINAGGEVTLVGRNALKRWMEPSSEPPTA